MPTRRLAVQGRGLIGRFVLHRRDRSIPAHGTARVLGRPWAKTGRFRSATCSSVAPSDIEHIAFAEALFLQKHGASPG